MSRKGFSIAEAMITLVIVSVALAAMAPMMTQKAKPVITPEKWVDAQTAGNITRPTGLVGIGIAEDKNPDAKLHIKSDNGKLLLLEGKPKDGSNPRNITIDEYGQIKLTTNLIIDNRVEDPVNTPIIIKNSDTTIKDNATAQIDSEGNTLIKNYALRILANGGIRMNYRESEANKSYNGPLGIYVNEGKRFTIKEAGQVNIFYAKNDPNQYSDEPGKTTVFAVNKCDGLCNYDDDKPPTYLFKLDSDGNITVTGNIVLGGKLLNNKGTDLLASVSELQKLVAELKGQNDVLKAQNEALSQRIAVLEMDKNNPTNNFNRIVIEEDNKKNSFLKLLTLK